VHPLARSPELPRPESPWPSRPDGLAGHTRVARVPVRGTRLPTPATEGPSGPRIPVRARADTDAGRVRMNAHARVLGLPRSDHLASIEPGRLQRRRRQRRVLPRDPEVNQHELASVRAGGSHVQLAVSLRTEMMRVCHATAAFGSRSLASGARWHSRPVGHRTRRAMEAPRALVRKRSSTWCACLGMRCRTLLIRSRGVATHRLSPRSTSNPRHFSWRSSRAQNFDRAVADPSHGSPRRNPPECSSHAQRAHAGTGSRDV